MERFCVLVSSSANKRLNVSTALIKANCDIIRYEITEIETLIPSS